MEHVAAAYGVTGDHGDDRLGEAPDLDLDVQDVEPADALRVDIAVVAATPLVAARAEGFIARPGQDDDTDAGIVARGLECPAHLEHGRGPEGVAHLRTVDRDLGDPVPGLVDDVLILAGGGPGRLEMIFQVITPRAITSTNARRPGRRGALGALLRPAAGKQAHDLGVVVRRVDVVGPAKGRGHGPQVRACGHDLLRVHDDRLMTAAL